MEKTDAEKTKEYRKKTTLKLIENYKDLITKTFEVTDVDLLQEKIDEAEENEKSKEDVLLNAIKKRKTALDEVDNLLDKIEKLEKNIIEMDKSEDESNNESIDANPNKKHIRED